MLSSQQNSEKSSPSTWCSDWPSSISFVTTYCLLSQRTDKLSLNMSTKVVADKPKLARAASILIRAPTLTVREAMLAAEFSVSEASMKWLQWKVIWSLPLKTKCGLKHPLLASSILSHNLMGSLSCTDVSPLTDDSGSRHENIENLTRIDLKISPNYHLFCV